MVQGSCGIGKPFGADGKLAAYLATGATAKLLRRLEAGAKSLHALYEYGRLHGAVRLRWGFLDERLPVPWADRDEQTLYDLEKSALAMDVPLEVVVGSAPEWSEPWSRARLARVERDPDGWRHWLVGDDGSVIHEANVQRAASRFGCTDRAPNETGHRFPWQAVGTRALGSRQNTQSHTQDVPQPPARGG
jgi:hypothetical protein